MPRNLQRTRKSNRHRKAKKTDGEVMDQEEEYKRAPHTFVINRGQVGKNVGRLILDVRRVLEPFTASHLKARKKNVLKDFVSVAGVLNVSQMLFFTKNENGTNMRVVRTPRGPTLTFHVQQYTLARDVVSALRRPATEERQYAHHPLLVMNNFSGGGGGGDDDGHELKLMATMFQNMFPSININKVKLNSIRRCVLLNFNSEERTVELRHYNIKTVPVGMSRGVKKLIRATVPNLQRFDDVSDFLLRSGELSESEAELDGPHNEVVLAQEMGSRGNIKAARSAIRLTELGPRLTLKLIKIEEGICDGQVLFHEYKHLTDEDLSEIKRRREQKKKTKEKRKAIQDQNVKKKEAEKERLKQLSLEGMKKKAGKVKTDRQEEDESDHDGVGAEDGSSSSEEDDDVEYYKQEVGEAPDEDMRLSSGGESLKRKGRRPPAHPFRKKKKVGSGKSEGTEGKGFPKHGPGRKFPKGPDSREGSARGEKGQGKRQKGRPDKFVKKNSKGGLKSKKDGRPKSFKGAKGKRR